MAISPAVSTALVEAEKTLGPGLSAKIRSPLEFSIASAAGDRRETRAAAGPRRPLRHGSALLAAGGPERIFGHR